MKCSLLPIRNVLALALAMQASLLAAHAADAPAAAPAASTATAPAAASATAADSDSKTIDRNFFTCKYPLSWHEGTDDSDYKPETYFTLKSPNAQNTYVQFSIADKSADPQKLVDSLKADLDGPAITTLSTSKLTEWGNHKGNGIYLKGKILDIAPGGIKIFAFNSDGHNVLVLEYYFSSELKDLQADLDYISHNFTLKN